MVIGSPGAVPPPCPPAGVLPNGRFWMPAINIGSDQVAAGPMRARAATTRSRAAWIDGLTKSARARRASRDGASALTTWAPAWFARTKRVARMIALNRARRPGAKHELSREMFVRAINFFFRLKSTTRRTSPERSMRARHCRASIRMSADYNYSVVRWTTPEEEEARVLVLRRAASRPPGELSFRDSKRSTVSRSVPQQSRPESKEPSTGNRLAPRGTGRAAAAALTNAASHDPRLSGRCE